MLLFIWNITGIGKKKKKVCVTSYSSHEPSKNTEKAVWQTEDWFQIWPFYRVWRARSYFYPYCEKIMLVCDQMNSPAFSNSTSTPLNVWHHNWHTSSLITCRERPLPRWTFATVSTQGWKLKTTRKKYTSHFRFTQMAYHA